MFPKEVLFNDFTLRPGVIDVSVGPLLSSVGKRPDVLMREVETWIEAEMRRLDPEAYAGEAPRAAAAPSAALPPGGSATES